MNLFDDEGQGGGDTQGLAGLGLHDGEDVVVGDGETGPLGEARRGDGVGVGNRRQAPADFPADDDGVTEVAATALE